MTSSTLVPRFTVEPQSSVVRAGSSVALTCAVVPQTANIRWTLNGSAISPQAARRRGIELTRDGQLLIAAYNLLSPSSSSSSSASAIASRVSHDGVYQCAAVTQAGVIVSSEARLQTACTLPLFSVLYNFVVWWSGRRSRNLVVAGSTADRPLSRDHSRQVVRTRAPMSPRSKTWYWPKGGYAAVRPNHARAWRKVTATYRLLYRDLLGLNSYPIL